MNRGRENVRERASDSERGIKAAIKNGVGTLLSRTIIIIAVPLMSLAGSVGLYAAKVTLDGIAKDIHAVADDVSELKGSFKGLRGDVTQLQIGAATVSATLADMHDRDTHKK